MSKLAQKLRRRNKGYLIYTRKNQRFFRYIPRICLRASVARCSQTNSLVYIDDIQPTPQKGWVQYLNIVWILASFFLLYYAVTGDGQDWFNAFFFIINIFLVFWYLGIRDKKKKFDNEEIPGDKALGQWGY